MKLRRNGLVYKVLMFWFKNDSARIGCGVSVCTTFWILLGSIPFFAMVAMGLVLVVLLGGPGYGIWWVWRRKVDPFFQHVELVRVAVGWVHAVKAKVCPIITFE